VNSAQKGHNTRTPPLIKQITDGHRPPREDIARVQGITVMQDDDIALVMIDVNRARAGVDDEYHFRAGVEPEERLFLDLGERVVRQYDLGDQIVTLEQE